MRARTFFKTTVVLFAFSTFAVTATAALADEVKLPQTTAEHDAMAKSYKDQAAQYKKVADDHREMAAAYKKTVAMPESKGGVKNPWLTKMEKHCGMLAKDADKLAADAEKAAEHHTMRGQEIQGK